VKMYAELAQSLLGIMEEEELLELKDKKPLG
jgi:hypothetical protein